MLLNPVFIQLWLGEISRMIVSERNEKRVHVTSLKPFFTARPTQKCVTSAKYVIFSHLWSKAFWQNDTSLKIDAFLTKWQFWRSGAFSGAKKMWPLWRSETLSRWLFGEVQPSPVKISKIFREDFFFLEKRYWSQKYWAYWFVASLRFSMRKRSI